MMSPIFTSLAIQTHIEGLIIEKRILEAIPFSVRTSLFGARIIRVDCDDRAIHCADSTFHALLKTCIRFLILTHGINDLE